MSPDSSSESITRPRNAAKASGVAYLEIETRWSLPPVDDAGFEKRM